MGNTVKLSRMIPSIFMIIRNYSASGGSNNCQCMKFAVIFRDS